MIDQAEIHRKARSKDVSERLEAINEFHKYFVLFPDKKQAWSDLRRLTKDKDFSVQITAVKSMGPAFPYIPDKNQAWAALHKFSKKNHFYLRAKAVKAIGQAFPYIPDKEQAWSDLHRVSRDGEIEVRNEAAYSLGLAFPYVLDKNQAWSDIRRLTHDKEYSVRWRAAEAAGLAFPYIPDKEWAWLDLHRLALDEDMIVRMYAAINLGLIFSYIPDKKRACIDLHGLTQDKEECVRRETANAIGLAFSYFPDKEQAWSDLIELTKDPKREVRRAVAKAISLAYSDAPDKEKVYADLHQLSQNEERYVRRIVAYALGPTYPHVPDKEKAYADIQRLTQDNDGNVRRRATRSLSIIFFQAPDKEQAWADLHKLTEDEESMVRMETANAIGLAFYHISDKKQAWSDLIRLTQDKESWVQQEAAKAAGSSFLHVPDNKQAWADLHGFTLAEEGQFRRIVANVLGSSFYQVPDKMQAMEDLLKLTQDKEEFVRWNAAEAVGTSFFHFPDKERGWSYLRRLILDEDSVVVRKNAAKAIGLAFSHIPDKEQAWIDLYRLTLYDDEFVLESANYSLGQASIFMATEADNKEEFKEEIKNAIDFFERSSNEETYFNPSSFCLPFYRSFYTIAFEKTESEGEVQRYLAEAKSASKGSKNKEKLLEAVENLANALSEAQKVKDFDATKSDLKAYMQYCNRAADLIGDAAEDAPGAASILRRGMPIIGERIRDIQEKAEALCKETRGTPLEEFGLATYISAQELPTHDPLALVMSMGSMANSARVLCEYLPTAKKAYVCEQLDNLPGMELSEQGAAIARVFEYVQENIHIPKVQTVHISETEHEIVRIVVAQISFELTESFPFVLKNKDEVKTKVFSALDIAKQDGANIVCLPELCLYEEWIGEIKGKYPDMIVIGGSFYKDNKNICPVIMESDTDTPYQPKITASPFEHGTMGPRMISGDRIYRYETRFGKFVILICMDFDDLAHFFRETDIDMIFCPSFNSANERFHNEAHSHVERTPSYILIANTGLHGGTSIFGQLNNNYFGGLVDGGCKKRGDSTYKLCEVEKGQEEVIIADFNLDHKGAQVPTPSNLNKVIKSVDAIKKIPIQPDRSKI
ncbi:MAG: hypothetical protein GQ533_10310, partial [Methanosarcinaceae archaeon]|nr:hypothetical protein [Methanosarcinaceae archaeon]